MSGEPTDSAGAGLVWRWLTEEDVPAVWLLHRTGIAMVTTPGLVKPEAPGFYERMSGRDGLTLGVWADDLLVGYGVLQWQLAAEDDPRERFGLAPGVPLMKLAGAAVHPAVRGRGVHLDLIRQRRVRAMAMGARHLYATTAPANWQSWTNLVESGFAIRALVQKYGSLWRFLLHHDGAAVPDEAGELVAPEDHAAVAARLAVGARGVGWVRDADGRKLLRFVRVEP